MGDLLNGVLGGGGGGGSGGGPLGMLGMDMSLHKMPLVGNFFQNPMEIHMKEQQQQAARAYGQMRPEIQQARMNALSNTAGSFQPVNNALLSMYGPGAQTTNFGMPQGLTSPMGPSAMGVGQTRGTPNMAGQQGQPQGGIMGGKGPLGGLLGGKGPMGGAVTDPKQAFMSPGKGAFTSGNVASQGLGALGMGKTGSNILGGFLNPAGAAGGLLGIK